MYLLEVNRDGLNPLTGGARYRVKVCYFGEKIIKPICKFNKQAGALMITSSKPYRDGSFVNPTAALKSSFKNHV